MDAMPFLIDLLEHQMRAVNWVSDQQRKGSVKAILGLVSLDFSDLKCNHRNIFFHPKFPVSKYRSEAGKQALAEGEGCGSYPRQVKPSSHSTPISISL